MNEQTPLLREVQEHEIETWIDGERVLTRNDLLYFYPHYLKTSTINYWTSQNKPAFYQKGNKHYYPQQLIEKMLGIMK